MRKVIAKVNNKSHKQVKEAVKPSASKEKKPKTTLRHFISKVVKAVRGKKRAAPEAKKTALSLKASKLLNQEEQVIEEAKFDSFPGQQAQNFPKEEPRYNLPSRYYDDKIVLLPRDPWWAYTYWDITENRINEVISAAPIYERENLKWVVRVYDVTCVPNFDGTNAVSFFDVDVNYEANAWYLNVNQPERDWCVEIGLKNPMGKFFAVARSNVIKTPYFGISSIIDEEWAMPDDEYYAKVLGMGAADIGRSSMDRKHKMEEMIKKQISSPLASWGGSGAIGKEKEQDKFFLEVWTEVILYGRTEADAHVTVEGKKIKLRPDGTFSFRYALPVGDYQFEVEGTSNNKKYKIKKTPAVKRFDK
jgi:uncharacterized protein